MFQIYDWRGLKALYNALLVNAKRNEALERKPFQPLFFNNLTTDKCGCLWKRQAGLDAINLLHGEVKLTVEFNLIVWFTPASENKCLHLNLWQICNGS
jgi:hypothetical protein